MRQPRYAVRDRALLVIALLAFPVAPGSVQSQGNGRAPGELGRYVERAMRDWGVPGVAVAVVKNDSVVYANGFGVRELGKQERVTPRTLFAVGSTSKAFTAAALAMLVDEGKLRWDDPVSRHLPSFQLYDPYVTRELTVRDLLSHRSGLPGADRLWYGTGNERDEVVRRIRFLKPNRSFRSGFGYQNVMFLAAGQVVQAVSGRSWDDFVKDRIFVPLGMSATNTTTLALRGRSDVATPHQRIEGSVRPIAWRNIDNVAPAGSINSNVLEMAQWLRLQLGRGSYRGTKLLTPGVVREMHTPQTIIPISEEMERLVPETHFQAYGLGWLLRDYRGRKIAAHSGGIDGMRADVALVPEEQLGVVVLSNIGGSTFPVPIIYRVIDMYLDAPSKDWSAVMLASARQGEARDSVERGKIEAGRVSGTSPSLALAKYAGTYADSLYGEVRVSADSGKLSVQFGPLLGELQHWHFDTFRTAWKDPVFGKPFVTFTVGPRAAVTSLDLEGVGSFGRKADAPATAAASRQ
ncbi:MAG: serine hydrolase [Gemmatimonadaceae bacterium]